MSAAKELRELESACEDRILELVALWSHYSNVASGDVDALAALRQALHDAGAELARLERLHRGAADGERTSMVKAIGPEIRLPVRAIGDRR